MKALRRENAWHTLKYFTGLRYIFVPPLEFLPSSLRPHGQSLPLPTHSQEARPCAAVCCCYKHSACRAYSLCAICLHVSIYVLRSPSAGAQPPTGMAASCNRHEDGRCRTQFFLGTRTLPGQLGVSVSSGKEILNSDQSGMHIWMLCLICLCLFLSLGGTFKTPEVTSSQREKS